MSLVLFLDFDGPLCTERSVYAYLGMPCHLYLHPELSTGYWKFDPVSVTLLNKLQTSLPDLHTVVSSSWVESSDVTAEDVQLLFHANGLDLALHDDWRTPRARWCDTAEISMPHQTRADDIGAWLQDHPGSRYVILDDPDSGTGLKDSPFWNRTIFVNAAVGITQHDLRAAQLLFTYD